MKKVSFDAIIYPARILVANFSMHQRSERVNLNTLPGNFILDINGDILQKSSMQNSKAIITVVGGIDAYIHKKDNMPLPDYYMNEFQGYKLATLAYEFGRAHPFDGTIEMGNSQELYQNIYSAFRNGRG